MPMHTNGDLALPRHVGIIMDGNGRWATAHGKLRLEGHKRGAEVFGDTVRHAHARGIEFLTVYAFSTENWRRPKAEVDGLMALLRGYLRDIGRYSKENIRLQIIGDLALLDHEMRALIRKAEEGSRHNTGIHVNIALSYGGRGELAAAAKAIAELVLSREIIPDDIDETCVANYLYTAAQPDVDLIIRTGGERRISNFLLWQSAYAEYVFTDILWPDFDAAAFDAALDEFARRDRRLGGLGKSRTNIRE